MDGLGLKLFCGFIVDTLLFAFVNSFGQSFAGKEVYEYLNKQITLLHFGFTFSWTQLHSSIINGEVCPLSESRCANFDPGKSIKRISLHYYFCLFEENKWQLSWLLYFWPDS